MGQCKKWEQAHEARSHFVMFALSMQESRISGYCYPWRNLKFGENLPLVQIFVKTWCLRVLQCLCVVCVRANRSVMCSCIAIWLAITKAWVWKSLQVARRVVMSQHTTCIDVQSRSRGVILGGMCGDVLGAAVEGWPANQIKRLAEKRGWADGLIHDFIEAVHMGSYVQVKDKKSSSWIYKPGRYTLVPFIIIIILFYYYISSQPTLVTTLHPVQP